MSLGKFVPHEILNENCEIYNGSTLISYIVLLRKFINLTDSEGKLYILEKISRVSLSQGCAFSKLFPLKIETEKYIFNINSTTLQYNFK